jgi:hypothetical protein
MWTGLCLGFLYIGRFRPLLQMLPHRLRPRTAHSDGSTSVLVYFFQMAAVAEPVQKQKLATGVEYVLCVASQLAHMQVVSLSKNIKTTAAVQQHKAPVTL